MAEYERRIVDRFGDTLSIVPSTALSYSRGLRGDGSLEMTIDLDHPSIADPRVLQPWASEVLLLRRESQSDDWSVAHDGPILNTVLDVDGGTAQVTAGRVKAFLTKRKGGNFFNEPGYDLGAIADLILTRAQDRGLSPPPAGSSFSCAVSGVTTGVTRDFITVGQNTRRYDEILDEYAQGSPGFDYDFVTTWVGGSRSRSLAVYYPKQGSDVTTPLILGSGMTALKVTWEGDRAATHYNVWGTPHGDATLVGNTFVADSIIDVYTRLEEDETRADVDDVDRLHDLSLEALRVRTPPLVIPTATYVVCEATPWRFAGPGDTVPLTAKRGPVQLSGRKRIVNEKVTVAGGSESVELTFNDPVSP